MRLVIVEDNPADVTLFMEALRFHKITADVSQFQDGASAVATLQSNRTLSTPPPNLVFLDLNMPRVSGFDVLRLLRGIPECAGVPVAVFTSSQSPVDTENARKLGANRVVRKPTDLREFFDVVSLTIRELATDI